MTGNSSERQSVLVQSLQEIRRLRAELDTVQNAGTEPIAVVGMACRMPGGADSPEAFWEFLDRGGDGIGEIPATRWDIDRFYDPDPDAPGKMSTRRGGFLDDVDRFDAGFFGISPARRPPSTRSSACCWRWAGRPSNTRDSRRKDSRAPTPASTSGSPRTTICRRRCSRSTLPT